MNAKNQVQLLGNIGQEPELYTSEKGKKILKLSLATNETYKNQSGEKVTKTEWHNLVMFGSLAELTAKYLKKGSQALIQGKLTHRKYVNKENIEKNITEIVVDDVLFLDSNK